MADNYWCHPKVDIQSMYEAEVGSISTAILDLKSTTEPTFTFNELSAGSEVGNTERGKDG